MPLGAQPGRAVADGGRRSWGFRRGRSCRWAATSRRGRRDCVRWCVGRLETKGGNVVSSLTDLKSEEMIGPLQDAVGAVVEGGERRLRAVPAD